MPIWTTRSHQNTPIVDRLVSRVTITDPSHPLFKRTFPVIRIPRHCCATPVVIVELPNGEHRRIPCSATDLQGPISSQVPLAPISVRTLLPLANRVRRLLGVAEERPDENPDQFAASTDDSTPPTSAADMASPTAPAATATGPAPSRTAATSASDPTTQRRPRDCR